MPQLHTNGATFWYIFVTLLIALIELRAVAVARKPAHQQQQQAIPANVLKLKLANGTSIPLWEMKDDPGRRYGCAHTRYSVVECIRDYLDTNHDYAITENEIDDAKVRYMYWIERQLEWIVRGGDTVAVRQRCDLNHNGKIDLHDLVEWNGRCKSYTREQAEDSDLLCLCSCRAIDSISGYICDRARKQGQ